MLSDRKQLGFLIILQQSFVKQRFPLFEGQNTIGRVPGKTQIAIKDPQISTQHAKIFINHKQIKIIDVGSKNGTFQIQNKRRLDANVQKNIQEGQKYSFGEICWYVERINIYKSKQKNKQQKQDSQQQISQKKDNKNLLFELIQKQKQNKNKNKKQQQQSQQSSLSSQEQADDFKKVQKQVPTKSVHNLKQQNLNKSKQIKNLHNISGKQDDKKNKQSKQAKKKQEEQEQKERQRQLQLQRQRQRQKQKQQEQKRIELEKQKEKQRINKDKNNKTKDKQKQKQKQKEKQAKYLKPNLPQEKKWPSRQKQKQKPQKLEKQDESYQQQQSQNQLKQNIKKKQSKKQKKGSKKSKQKQQPPSKSSKQKQKQKQQIQKLKKKAEIKITKQVSMPPKNVKSKSTNKNQNLDQGLTAKNISKKHFQSKQQQKDDKYTKQNKPTKNKKRKPSVSQQSIQQQTQNQATSSQNQQLARHTRSGGVNHPMAQRSRQRINKIIRFMVSGSNFMFNQTPNLKWVTNIQDEYDVLIMQTYIRTYKLLLTISKGIPIVHKNWITESIFFKTTKDMEMYWLTYPGDKQRLKKSVQLVQNGFKVFDNKRFLIVSSKDKLRMKFQQLQKLIYINGGQVIQFISKNQKNKLKDVYLILQEKYDKEELNIAKGINKEMIFSIQFVLQSIVEQEMKEDDWKIQV